MTIIRLLSHRANRPFTLSQPPSLATPQPIETRSGLDPLQMSAKSRGWASGLLRNILLPRVLSQRQSGGFSFRMHRDFPQSGLGEHRHQSGGKLITSGGKINFLERFLKGSLFDPRQYFKKKLNMSFPAPVIRLSIERNEHGCH